MNHKTKSRAADSQARRAVCEDVRFAEVEFDRPSKPGLIIEFSDGLKLLVEDARAVDLAAEFIAAFRTHERKVRCNGFLDQLLFSLVLGFWLRIGWV